LVREKGINPHLSIGSALYLAVVALIFEPQVDSNQHLRLVL
jgi:hypothetical protein